MNTKQLVITALCVASLISLPACGNKKCCKQDESVEIRDNRENGADILVADEALDITDEEITIVLEEEKQSSTLKF